MGESKDMLKRRKNSLIIYRLSDIITAALAWFFFFAFRKKYELSEFTWSNVFEDNNLVIGLLLIPLGWFVLYFLFDSYYEVYRRSRLNTLIHTFYISLGGCLFLLFTILADDEFLQYETYVLSFIALFLMHFTLTGIFRILLLHYFRSQILSGQVWFNTLLIGSGTKTLQLYQEIVNTKAPIGNKVVGLISTDSKRKSDLTSPIPVLGNLTGLFEIINKYQIEEVIIALQENEHSKLAAILEDLLDNEDSIEVKIIPDMYYILSGSVKMRNVFGLPLVSLDRSTMPQWESALKRVLDITVSLIILVMLSPVIMYIAIRVKLSSPGPIIFRQERIGKNRKPFQIIKFRSMFENAEKDGPRLSSDGDKRCTIWGAKMRKWRLDEIPQFLNVLRGEMSLVGPRPEREYYISQIKIEVPHYKHIFRVRPGITSLGQVKYGYASNISQMLKRLKFDLIYIENMSIGIDIKILFYTIIVLLKGEGK